MPPNTAPAGDLRARWRGFFHQTGLPPLWLLVFLFAGAFGVEVLRAQGQVAPLMLAVCVFAIACTGAALAGHERVERALLILPCLWIIGSAVLGVVAVQQWYTARYPDRDFYLWIREGFLNQDWSLGIIAFGRLAGGRGGSSALSFLLILPALAVPGVLLFSAFRKLRAPERLPWELPPGTGARFSMFLAAVYLWLSYGLLLPLLPLLIRRPGSTTDEEWKKHARWWVLIGGALFGLVLALHALSRFNSFSYGRERMPGATWVHFMEGRVIFVWCVLQLVLLIPTLWGSRMARAAALGLSLLPAPLYLAAALWSGEGMPWELIRLSGFSALALAYLPLRRKPEQIPNVQVAPS